ncbi:hypothetical protein [Bartonella sp. B1099]|uniref:hypothetical protein n=1 Tax=Bartonella sp. B1099 TaxID=2911422 RepID=UPI0020C5447A|nr:hypothetical protein [Bartonella sp. B1099]
MTALAGDKVVCSFAALVGCDEVLCGFCPRVVRFDDELACRFAQECDVRRWGCCAVLGRGL